MLSQLLNSLSEKADMLEEAYNSGETEEVEKIKREILDLQKRIADLVK